MGFGFSSSGSFDNTERWLKRLGSGDIYRSLDRYGQAGVEALSRATPQDTGATAASWRYTLDYGNGGATIQWYNTHAPYGEVVALLIQYGHGTGTGGYVRGLNYINPAIRPIFEQAIAAILKEVST